MSKDDDSKQIKELTTLTAAMVGSGIGNAIGGLWVTSTTSIWAVPTMLVVPGIAGPIALGSALLLGGGGIIGAIAGQKLGRKLERFLEE